MIQSNELRTGNWVYDVGNTPVQVIRTTKDKLALETPISLSAEILGKAGFWYLDFGTRKKYILEDFEISLYPNGEFTFMWNGQIVYVKSVHQLQNIFYWLTGEELPVEL